MELSNIISLDALDRYKLHAARHNGHVQPLDIFVQSKVEWQGWNEWRGTKNEFNRQFILSIMDFYPERHIWLFGGVFEVLHRFDDRYEVKLCDNGKELIGRLKVKLEIKRGRSFLLENYYDQMEIVEVLREPYVAECFPGYENICMDFKKLKIIFEHDRLDWKSALSNTKGIYVISDKSTGKKYVGKADGESGIWSRWSAYLFGGSGGNIELVKLIEQKGMEYVQQNFQLTLIEAFSWKTPDSLINKRESFWKKALLTSRDQFGYNAN